MRMEKKHYLQVYLEECKYRTKNTKITKFIEDGLKSESESELESDNELELKSGTEFWTTDFERVILLEQLFPFWNNFLVSLEVIIYTL